MSTREPLHCLAHLYQTMFVLTATFKDSDLKYIYFPLLHYMEMFCTQNKVGNYLEFMKTSTFKDYDLLALNLDGMVLKVDSGQTTYM